MQTGTAVSTAREPELPVSPDRASAEIRSRFFAFFLISGFCSVLYEVIWLRLAMASFGVTSAMTSIVISVFMAGLGAGSYAAGKLTQRLAASRFPRIQAYALTELVIGIGSLVVPYELVAGRKLLEAIGVSSSVGYYAAAGLWLAIALIPWCTAMGATFPIAMWAMRNRETGEDRGRSFSYLYVANVLGALGGTLLPLLLIESMGFRGTLRVGGIMNLGLAMWAFALSRQHRIEPESAVNASAPATQPGAAEAGWLNLALLFSTGLTSMGMEVVWIRMYTPYLGTVVYAFAIILGTYLVGTFLGSVWYRKQRDRALELSPMLWAVLGMASLLPLASVDGRIGYRFFAAGVIRVVAGITPFTVLLGFLTPMLVDRVSGGDPNRAGSAYALNVLGCIIGPLIAGFFLLPLIGERWALAVLASVWVAAGAYFALRASPATAEPTPQTRQLAFAASALIAALLVGTTRDFAYQLEEKVILRDNTATVIATKWGQTKLLLINGVGITALTPITKIMAHFPMALLDRPPQHVLDICFGMGTTYRSMLTWDVRTDAAELVPSVPKVFPYFHPDAGQVLSSPLGHINVDDGRRHLERTQNMYDVITIDPPPPVEAAGSSLLYSKEFYQVAKRKLRPGGILAQWLPGGDVADQVAVTRAVQESFTYVRTFVSIEGWGLHLIASDSPIPNLTPQQLVDRLPAKARTDLVEWGPYPTPEAQFTAVLKNEVRVEDVVRRLPSVPAMTDDHPINEYNLLRGGKSE